MASVGISENDLISRRIRACDYISVAEIFLKDNFLVESPLKFDHIKKRLLGHWGTCHGINVAYANLKMHFRNNPNFMFILGPGHGFPALNANLYLDGDLLEVDGRATLNYDGLAYVCRYFSWPDGFPSHASPMTPMVVTEGGELGYALATAYGMALGHPEKVLAVLIGDGELETATALDSLNLKNLVGGEGNGRVMPILHLNGYKISGPTIYARKSEKELDDLICGFGFTPVWIDGDEPEVFQNALNKKVDSPFYILKTEKGAGGPNAHQDSHQVPLKKPAFNYDELHQLEEWLKSYRFTELFDKEKGVLI